MALSDSEIQQHVKDILSGKEILFTAQEIINNLLIPLDENYYSDSHEDTLITDSEYDALYNITRALSPTNVYFTGVGSDVRGEKVKLPYQMGSLDQVYDVDLDDWINNNQLEDELIITTEKLDGVSCMFIYDQDGHLQIAYSRGNGLEGADITRHIRKLISIPQYCKELKGCALRGEIIVSKENFNTLQTLIKTRANQIYKNARNLVAGLMNAKENPDNVYQYIDLVGYEIINKPLDKQQQLSLMNSANIKIPTFKKYIGCQLKPEHLTSIIKEIKSTGKYEIDGVVLDVDSSDTRLQLNPTRDTFNPAYSVKYKVLDIDNIKLATVKNVQWNISKHGYLKPKVIFNPIDLGGVTVKQATGFNAKFINDNRIGKGSVVELVRSGDVIPFIQKVITSSNKSLLPSIDLEWEWNETEVDIVLKNPNNNPEVKIQQLIDFFASLNVAHLKEGNIRKFAEYLDTTSLNSFLTSDVKDWKLAIGTNGEKIYNSLQERFKNIPIYELMGATSFFGRGLGRRKFKVLLQNLHFNDLINADAQTISNVEGFDEKTAQKIINGMNEFLEWKNTLPEYVNIVYEMNLSEGFFQGHKICFTGFRDKVLSETVESLGGTIQSAVSSKTTYLVASNPNSNSTKMKKAKQIPGITIMSVEEFKEFLQGL